jgi:hypothetical protein
VGEEEAGHRVMAGDTRGGSGTPASAATDGIGGAGRGGGRGGAGRGRRKRGGGRLRAPRVGAEDEGGAGRPGLRVRLGRGRGVGRVGFGGGGLDAFIQGWIRLMIGGRRIQSDGL